MLVVCIIVILPSFLGVQAEDSSYYYTPPSTNPSTPTVPPCVPSYDYATCEINSPYSQGNMGHINHSSMGSYYSFSTDAFNLQRTQTLYDTSCNEDPQVQQTTLTPTFSWSISGPGVLGSGTGSSYSVDLGQNYGVFTVTVEAWADAGDFCDDFYATRSLCFHRNSIVLQEGGSTVVPLNNGDADADCVADSLEFDGSGGGKFVPIQMTYKGADCGSLQLSYGGTYGWETLGVTAMDNTSIFSSLLADGYNCVDDLLQQLRGWGNGHIYRLWTKDQDSARNPNSIMEGGDFVPMGAYEPHHLFPNGTTRTFYLESFGTGGLVPQSQNVSLSYHQSEALPPPWQSSGFGSCCPYNWADAGLSTFSSDSVSVVPFELNLMGRGLANEYADPDYYEQTEMCCDLLRLTKGETIPSASL